MKKPVRLSSNSARHAWPATYTSDSQNTVLYLPKNRSEIQPPSSGKKYTPMTKMWKMSFAAPSRIDSGRYASRMLLTRNGTRMLRMP